MTMKETGRFLQRGFQFPKDYSSELAVSELTLPFFPDRGDSPPRHLLPPRWSLEQANVGIDSSLNFRPLQQENPVRLLQQVRRSFRFSAPTITTVVFCQKRSRSGESQRRSEHARRGSHRISNLPRLRVHRKSQTYPNRGGTTVILSIFNVP